MIRLQVSPQIAFQYLQKVRHAVFQKGLENHWNLNEFDNVRAQSILWLFCWATTGKGSPRAAGEAREAFNRIFDRSYDWLSRRITLEYARANRYAERDLEKEFSAKLSQVL